MELKIQVKKVPFEFHAVGTRTINVMGVYLDLHKRGGDVPACISTGVMYCENVSTADIEQLLFQCGLDVGDNIKGITVRSKHSKNKWVQLGDPSWRG